MFRSLLVSNRLFSIIRTIHPLPLCFQVLIAGARGARGTHGWFFVVQEYCMSYVGGVSRYYDAPNNDICSMPVVPLRLRPRTRTIVATGSSTEAVSHSNADWLCRKYVEG